MSSAPHSASRCSAASRHRSTRATSTTRSPKIPAAARGTASSSIAGALQVAEKLPARAGAAFATAAQTAFVDGIHVAAIFGVALAIVAALVTRKFLPRTVADVGPMHSGVEALENAAEFGLGGAMPVFPDATPAAAAGTTTGAAVNASAPS